MLGSAMLRCLVNTKADLLLTTRKEIDLYNQAQVFEWMEKNQPDYVFHIGAKVGGIVANKELPADFIVDNLMIQTNVIQGAHLAKVKRLVFVASNCTYPAMAPQPLKETALLSGPPDESVRAYAVSKIAGIET
jgi:GDP-L-fucose synthase